MRRILDFVYTELRPGGLLAWLTCFLAAAFFAVDSVLSPETKYFSLFFVILGLSFGWRHYIVWRRKRAQRGLALVGTEKEIEELERWP